MCSPESILVNPLDAEVVLVKVTLQQHSLDGVEVRTLQYLVFLEFEEDRVNVVRDSHMMILFVAKLGKILQKIFVLDIKFILKSHTFFSRPL